MSDKGVERRLLVLFGSQTGTAEEVAERIWRESKLLHWSGPVYAMDRYDINNLTTEKIVIFVCSTTGQGEEPDNMKATWKFLLRKSLSNNFLCNTKFAVLGLGDSSYTKYNFVAKRLYKRLLLLGATPLMELALANDQHDLGPEAVIAPWMASLWVKLGKICPTDLEPQCAALFPPRYVVTMLGTRSCDEAGDSLDSFHSANSCASTDSFHSVTSTSGNGPKLEWNVRTTSEAHFQDVRLLRIRAPDLVYNPGDVLQVQPCNLKENVDCFLDLLGLSGTDVLNVVASHTGYSLPLPASWEQAFPCSFRECASKLIDLQAAPQLYALQLLAHFTRSKLEKERLLEFCTPEGQEQFIEYCHRPKRTVLELLQDFPVATAALPITYFFDIFKPLRPRSFSIASASEACNGCVELLVAVVKYTSRMHTPRLGLCSNWMARLKPGDLVPCTVRPGSLIFPKLHNIPLIMVGPGTGCAPFRSLVQLRHALGSTGRLILFLGFRNKQGDFHCRNEWQSYVNAGLVDLFCAFSRDQKHKIYVQHKILEQGALVWKLLDQDGAYFYVAGNSKNMPICVREAVVQLIGQNQPCTQQQAEFYVEQLEKSGRYQTETWA